MLFLVTENRTSSELKQTMNKTHFGFICLVILTIAFSSCSVEKRIHQDGYHITWKHRHASSSESNESVENMPAVKESLQTISESPQSNVHLAETISASSNQTNDLILTPKRTVSILSHADTVVPDPNKQQEEYFSNNYTNPLPTNELQDTKLANWALGLGIGAVSSPLWVTILFLLLFAIVGASWSSVSVWTALGLAFILGGGIFITLEILAFTLAIRFLRMHGKDPNYRKYRSRAITGLILASIYPALMLLNIIISLAFII